MILSIITINYNDAIGLKRTVESVLGQTFSDFEYIVIDGGSDDGSREYLKEVSDNIDYWISEPDKGIYSAMNKGIAEASGKYLMFLNSGDWFCSPDTLDNVFCKEYDADVVYGNIMIEKNGCFIRKTNGPKNSKISTTYFLYDTIYHQSSFIKRESLNALGNYDESYKIISDWVMFLRMAMNRAKFEYVAVDVSFFDGQGVSSQNYQQNEDERNTELLKPEYESIYSDYLAIRSLKVARRMGREYEIVKGSKFLYFFIKVYLRLHYRKSRKKLLRDDNKMVY